MVAELEFFSCTSLFDAIINQFHLPFVVTTYPTQTTVLTCILLLCLPSGRFPSTFLTKSLAYLVSPTFELLTCPGELSFLIFSNG